MADDTPITMADATAIMEHLASRAVTTAEGVKALRRSHDNLLKALINLVDRVDRNGGIGEYQGGPAFVMKAARDAIAAATTEAA